MTVRAITSTAPFTLFLLFIVSAILIPATHDITSAAEAGPNDPNTPKADPNTEDANKSPQRPTHDHPAFSERTEHREKMVSYQMRARGIKDPNVLRAMNTVPRHAFVEESLRPRAYGDHPLPIGYNQTISQPYIVAYMTEALHLTPDSNVLEIGTGSGYQAAVAAEIAAEVYTIEIIEPLAAAAKDRLAALGYRNVRTKAADGFYGWPDHAPFDAIIITAAASFIPPPLIEQLKPSGRMIIPLGSPYGVQTLVLVTKNTAGRVTTKRLLPVRFVPMLGRAIEKTK